MKTLVGSELSAKTLVGSKLSANTLVYSELSIKALERSESSVEKAMTLEVFVSVFENELVAVSTIADETGSEME